MNGVWTILRRSPRAAAGAGILLVMFLMALFAPLLTPYSPTSQDFSTWIAPGREHLLGTTALGQDVWAQILYGARKTLLIGLMAGLIATMIGTTIGVAGAYFGGRVEDVL